MILYERNHGMTSNISFVFDFGNELCNINARSIVLNEKETHLIIVGNHELKLIHFERPIHAMANTIGDDQSMVIPYCSQIQSVPLFNPCNVNRPIVQWNQHDGNQYALAIDRLLRFYTIDYGKVHEMTSIIDTQHQRPVSTITYSPYDPQTVLTGSLDGQVQLWDVRNCSSKAPASLKLVISTPLCVRHIQWASISDSKTNNCNNMNSNLLAIQCDRCVRIYDMRQPKSYLSSIEHSKRILSMDWTRQKQSIVTLSNDNSLRMFSSDGRLLAESLADEPIASHKINKIRMSPLDNLIISASHDSQSSTYGLFGWQIGENHRIEPLINSILTLSPSTVDDFQLVSTEKFTDLFHQMYSTQSNESASLHLPVLAWCHDEQLRLIEMDYAFRRTFQELNRIQRRQAMKLSNRLLSPSRTHRINGNNTTIDGIEDETTPNHDQNGLADNNFQGLSLSKIVTIALSENGDDHDISGNGTDRSMESSNFVTIENELNSLGDNYGPYINIELKDEQRCLCIVRCIYPSENASIPFRIHLFLSRHYPVISQLFVRFKLAPLQIVDERFNLFQQKIQCIFDETSSKCFYYGQLCLHQCLLKLKQFFQLFVKQEELILKRRAEHRQKKTDDTINYHDYLDNAYDFTNGKNYRNTHSNPIFDLSLSSMRHHDENHLPTTPSIRANPRTCAARFSGANHLVCFGRTSNLLQEPSSAPAITNSVADKSLNRPNSFHVRSTSLTVSKTQGNSIVEEHARSFRLSASSSKNVHIQSHSSVTRSPMFSAPVRSSYGNVSGTDQQRLSISSISYRHSINQDPQSNSTVCIYDLSILLPVSKKLADDYSIDFSHPIEMCEKNEALTQTMGKYELAHCWHLLNGLLKLQSVLEVGSYWFGSPLAHGLIEHLFTTFVNEGDIQSASMFLLTMLKSTYMAKEQTNQSRHSILYAYASLLHRWKHFFKRTQVLQQIDSYNCSITSGTHSTTRIYCSLCLQPVLGQYVICAVCGHGGHLTHLHQWFSSPNLKHRFCPAKDCSCRCLMKQQELLTASSNHHQTAHQHLSTSLPRAYPFRQLTCTSLSSPIRSRD